ncbi:MAG: lysylphosphatidylglycerol synthase transmembrane domain-containing protein [Alphaproteobacteria bacterium]|nr:lysylphosphatidylglycerol synthase transmembrane domain-containing protein [Alphaproteobacteria bacterium]
MQIISSRIVFTLIKWILSGGMLAYALHAIDVRQVADMLARQNPLVPVAVIALIIAQMAISTFRWQRLLGLLSPEKPMGYGTLFNLNFINIFFNSCLPGTIGGDVVRAMLLKSEKLPLSLCIHSVIIDRLFAVFGVVAMVVASLPWLGERLPALPVWLLMGASFAGFIIGMVLLAKLPQLFVRLPSTTLVRHSWALLESLRRVMFSPGDATVMLVQAIASHGCFCLGVYLLGTSIGVAFTLMDCLILVPPVLLLMMLPVSVGGWGVREVSMVGLLALAGVPSAAALTISVQFGLLSIIASLPGAWCYARRRP